MIVVSASISVGSMRCAISVVTGRLEKIETPRSPRSEIAEPIDELQEDRLVQPELGADFLDLLGGRVVARDHGGRIAGREAQQQEHDQRHHAHHRDGGEDALEDEGEHLAAAVYTSPRHAGRGSAAAGEGG